jgi:AraC-like DNA-binding protein
MKVVNFMSSTEKALTENAFFNRENSFMHSPYEKEFEFYEYVKQGDIEKVKQVMTPLGTDGSGKLSEDPLQNLRYHFVVTIALVTRFCVEGGMSMESAYTLSDVYIMKADKCRNENELHDLHREAVLEYTGQMKKLHRDTVYSKPVTIIMDYIYENLHTKILLEDIAAYTGLSSSYMSRLFHSEVGITVTEYIARKRTEAAQNLLRYSDYSPTDISNYLAFSSYSHFIRTFKSYAGMTPGEYRKKYFRSNWGEK